MNDLRILCTGNPTKAGITNSISKTFSNVECIHLSNGYDLVSKEGQDKFRAIIKNYNVFVNVSQLSNNSQEALLKIAHESGMTGHVFNIGSIAEYKKWEWYDPAYTAEKRSLRETSLELCSEHFKTTHIIAGGFQDYSNDSPSRMDPQEVANIIKYILNSPINIPVIGIEKITDKATEEYLNGNIHYS